MLIGAMNHPQRDIIEEIAWMAEMKLDFIDLSLEPPAAASWNVNLNRVKKELDAHHLKVVGHTAYYLPLASPFEDVRHGAVEELKRCIEAFAHLGAKWMNIHPDRDIPMHSREFIVRRNLESLHELTPAVQGTGVGIMVENLPGEWNLADQLAELLDRMPELGLHLDIGHANIGVRPNSTEEIVKRFGSRLRHVHLHDNKGHADDHLPLGAGTMDIPKHLRTLKHAGYNGTITLEVFTADRHYFKYSRDLLRAWWDLD